MAPRVTRAARERQRRSVVLPAPDLPMTATNWPGSIVTDRPSRAGAAFPGKILATLSSVTAGDRSATIRANGSHASLRFRDGSAKVLRRATAGAGPAPARDPRLAVSGLRRRSRGGPAHDARSS